MTRHRSTPRRRPGRPRQREAGDATGQRERLLDAAVALFARQGVAATPLLAVAREAGVTPALLHYYFGTREQLLDVLVQERLVPVIARVLQGVVDAGHGGGLPDDPVQLLQVLARALMETAAVEPWLPPIWVREVLAEGGLLRDRVLVQGRLYAPLLAGRLAEAQRAGRMNPALDPRLTLVSLVGLAALPFAAAPIWRTIFDASDITTDTLVRHVTALLAGGIGVTTPEAGHETD